LLFILAVYGIFFQSIARRQAMLVFAFVSIVGTTPVPPILVFFSSFEEEFADDIRSAAFYYFSFPFSDRSVQLFLSETAQLFTSNCVHNQLCSLVHVKIDVFSSVKSEIVGVYAFFALLADALFEVGADDVGWILLFRFFTLFEFINIVIEGAE
jgi:hypothetical protein